MIRTLWVFLIAYENAARTAIQAYNEYILLRHQSESNLVRHGLKRDALATEIFRKHYGTA
jgi:hypothetical protein